MFRFEPFDFQLLASLEKPEYDWQMMDFCYGMQYTTKTMDLEITMEVEVKECSFGMFGILIGDVEDCYWRTYTIDQPIAGIEFLHALDIDDRNYFFPWYCNYDLYSTSGIDITKLG